MGELNSLFMDATEKKAAILGEGFLYKFLEEGCMKSHFCVLTDKRVYVKGRYFHSTGRAYRVREGDYTIDVKDVTGSGFSTARFGFVFALGIAFVILLSVLAGFFLLFVEKVDHVYFGLQAIVSSCFIVMCIGLVAVPVCYLVRPFKIFVIEYTGGKIAFLSFELLEPDFRAFQQELYKAKDAFSPVASRRDGCADCPERKDADSAESLASPA
ncbi:hypothetical protein [uncultured Acetatifactor sp.]|jgi:hypothetical protein|uniref:hypothetical protein n=1 Tax=uncultured Acetatifactor sp. TaxID=1671927 RepID=UPI00261B7744|nr:hypothetical protein [uncultured Acetatifactor sp.]